MNLNRLLLIHAIVTFAAAIVLIVAPTLIPQTVNIQINKSQYVLCYFLGAAELAIAYLSFYSRRIEDESILRIISTTFIIFHAATGILEAYGLTNGLSTKIIANIVLRVIIVLLFYHYGIFKKRSI